MIQGKVDLAGHILAIQDGQLMIFIPNAEGNSEPVSEHTVRKLRFLLQLAIEHYNAQEASNGSDK